MSDDSDREVRKRQRRRVTVILVFLIAVVAYQLLRLHAEVASAEVNFKSLIAEYHVKGEPSFRNHLTTALRADGFHIAPGDLRVVEADGGVAVFTLTYKKRYRILLFPMTRDVSFEVTTLSTAS